MEGYLSDVKCVCRPFALSTCFILNTGPATVFRFLITFPAAERRLYFAVLVALISLATADSEVKIHVSKNFVKKDYALIKVPEFPISLPNICIHVSSEANHHPHCIRFLNPST